MSEQTYHHGNLRQALIEYGIQMINEEGISHLSMRKLAMRCHVSHAAPYNHFKDKNELIDAIKLHISDHFSQELKKTIEKYQGQEAILVELGVQYILYFLSHREYYRFLFTYFNCHVIITDTDVTCDDFSVFMLYRKIAIAFMKEQGIDESQYNLNILATWAIVEGLTSILISENTVCSLDVENMIREILRKKVCLT